jgi:hypothetical protein
MGEIVSSSIKRPSTKSLEFIIHVILKDGALKQVNNMAKYSDALRGYAFLVHKRDGFKCRFCGLDGTKSFDSWLSLSWDHLLPKGHPERDNPEFIVTACNFCNTADNRYFDLALKRGLKFDNMTQDELIAQRLPYVMKTRGSYREFWEENVFSQEGKTMRMENE